MRSPAENAQVKPAVVTAVVCLALGAVVSAMASLNVGTARPRSEHSGDTVPARVDHRCLFLDLRLPAPTGRSCR